jgi:AraC-like DNA-binding protein
MRVLGSFGLIYMVEVEGYYLDASGADLELRSGDVVWIHPGLAHAYGPTSGTAWTQIYVILEGLQWEQWAASGLLDPRQPVTHAAPVDYWQSRLREVFPIGGTHDSATTLHTMGAIWQLIPDLLAAQEESTRSADDAWFRESQRLLGERQIDRSLTPQAVARAVGLSYENFRKRFADRMGVSPGQYQKQRRIDHARAAIYQGTHSFKALADELGFCDVFHFSKTFRQIVGKTPSEFRRKARGL